MPFDAFRFSNNAACIESKSIDVDCRIVANDNIVDDDRDDVVGQPLVVLASGARTVRVRASPHTHRRSIKVAVESVVALDALGPSVAGADRRRHCRRVAAVVVVLCSRLARSFVDWV